MTGNPLVIIAHPHLHGSSRVNRRWLSELRAHSNEFDVRDLYALYPDGQIDDDAVADEQAALESHDLIVFQFPVYWYSCPALLRTWMDRVLAFGWAYGGDRALPGEPGRKLAGKRFAFATSAGDSAANYSATGAAGFTFDEIMVPFRATVRFLGATCETHAFTLFATENDITDSDVEASAHSYLAWLRDIARRDDIAGERSAVMPQPSTRPMGETAL
ncbi:NAD(P)H dehydrogenase (quinone) [Coriobacterium glomerans PW2]|uniref:NAD(P)H dehydrogenase (Quinone) n=1 Tax=Coriobacterium glomerans (strain ATCC 49209 / DSM 20642 / JCM 10262 / PW2) TaxID=700015 RepID=F2N9V6_CORGP|nr:NAD(P)H-dependent oxidoreductase [Coriobacterium glomerans]AEB06211.1 NAD(P)H dehydrogenase (quinone) [Coriobacterium glomerans PW2]